jgi:PIN domain nuclease of toxin-antitoxin system
METGTGIAYLDTHVVVWLYGGSLDLLPESVQELLERSDLRISPMVALELQYLFETGRIRVPADAILRDLEARIDLRVCDFPFGDVVRVALNESWTRDPFDRVIVSQAKLRNLPLVTKDRTIRKHFRRAVWD